MTICIAAITNNENIFALTDKKYTVNHGITSGYEITENKKAVELTPSCIALFAGNIVNANQILANARSTITATDTVKDVALKVQQAHNEKFKADLDQFLMQYNLDIDSFNAQQTTFDPTFVRSTLETISKSNLGVEILVVGKDGSTPKLMKMLINGSLEDDTSLGYVCIGSGANHAQLSLIESECHSGSSKEAVLYALLKAKRKAQYDPGVGKLSDLLYISDSIKVLDVKLVDKLWNEYEASVIKITDAIKQSSDKMKALAGLGA